jgi:hypothetical protein
MPGMNPDGFIEVKKNTDPSAAATGKVKIFTDLSGNVKTINESGLVKTLTNGIEDVTQKLIPVAAALSPALSGASLSAIETSDSLFSDSLDFSVGDRAFFNFVMLDSYSGNTDIDVELLISADSTGTVEFDVVLGFKDEGDDFNSSAAGTPVSESETIAVAEQIYKKTITIPSSNHSVVGGGLLIAGITRTGGTLVDDMRILGCQIKW